MVADGATVVGYLSREWCCKCLRLSVDEKVAHFGGFGKRKGLGKRFGIEKKSAGLDFLV